MGSEINQTAVDLASLGWAVFAWLIVLTGGGAFFMGQLFERVKSHNRRLDEHAEEMASQRKDHDTELSAIRSEQTQIATAFAAMKAKMDETHRYSIAIWKKLSERAPTR